MSVLRNAYFIVGAKRTAIGAYGGTLKNHTVTDMAVIAAQAALKEANVDPKLVQSIVMGNIIHSNPCTPYMPRHVGMRVGANIETPAYAVNRLCGSGFQSIISGLQELEAYSYDIGIVGGSENMSAAPFTVRNMRFGTRFDLEYKMEDSLQTALYDSFIKLGMGVTAENIAKDINATRGDVDALAFDSQMRWHKANEAGIFKDEIVPISTKDKRGKPFDFCVDEHPRPSTTLESLSKLKPVFAKEGVSTAGNSSGISDGAAVLIIASEKAVKEHKLKPLARITGYSVTGCEPTRMGMGPVPAIKMLMKALKMNEERINENFDHVEVNEAFAVQCLGVERALGLSRDLLNKNGGAVAIGHPVGASGSRIMAHLAHQINNKLSKKALGSACIGGGQGIAISLESA